MEELRECPFCGCEANYTSRRGPYGAFVWVECCNCGARSKNVFSGEEDFSEKSLNNVTSLWNWRYEEEFRAIQKNKRR